ncbi:hypothetical protein LTR84_002899 [Exophiala bonariae]|uniref:BZIP domain-containing protein n=1 Tax=Exophiala bonariae TaxID=1690606 RepID=A0AAV9ND03_9EURO|nr:hypothetical protein LTR84_002899 [Exophiala bonariae]
MATTSPAVAGSTVVELKRPAPTTSNSGPQSTKKKPYVRQLTDKRREQNRRAQKIYREKLRKRLEDLEEQAAATGTTSTSSSSALGTPASRSTVNHVPIRGSSRQETSGLDVAPLVAAGDKAAEYLNSRMIRIEDAFLAAGDLPISHNPLTIGVQFDVIPSPPASEPEPEPTPESIHTHDDYGDLDLRPIWPMPPRKGNRPYLHDTPSSSYDLALTAISARRAPNSPRSSVTSSKTVPDIYANNLRLVGVGTIEASIAVGLCLRITRSAYINDHPSPFPGCCVALNSDAAGPKSIGYNFFQTHFAITTKLSEHISGVRGALRPSPAQMMNPHPCYLDCIVFPYFRDQTVQASMQGILDHEQLFLDIFHGGLVCWGGASDMAKSRRARKRQMSDNVAWSTRSWEAKKWFLRKYSWLIGTEEDEDKRGDADGIWKSSRWWWNMRGDVDSEDDGDDSGNGEDDDGEDPFVVENTIPIEFKWGEMGAS